MGSAIVSALVNVAAKNPQLMESIIEGVLNLLAKEIQAKTAKA